MSRALKYLHALAKEVFGHPDDESGAQSEADRVTNHTKPDPDTPRRGRGTVETTSVNTKRTDHFFYHLRFNGLTFTFLQVVKVRRRNAVGSAATLEKTRTLFQTLKKRMLRSWKI